MQLGEKQKEYVIEALPEDLPEAIRVPSNPIRQDDVPHETKKTEVAQPEPIPARPGGSDSCLEELEVT